MSAEFAEGLRLAGAGMGLVFATLVALMVILFALGRLFPGEEEEAEAPATQAAEALEETAAPVAEPPRRVRRHPKSKRLRRPKRLPRLSPRQSPRRPETACPDRK